MTEISQNGGLAARRGPRHRQRALSPGTRNATGWNPVIRPSARLRRATGVRMRPTCSRPPWRTTAGRARRWTCGSCAGRSTR